jgi:cell division protein ZapA (FtsZ GTPase activity inhibitor)
MAKITINDKEYDVGLLPERARGNIASIQFVDAEIQRIESQLSVLKTARLAYLHELNGQLQQTSAGDNIKFN